MIIRPCGRKLIKYNVDNNLHTYHTIYCLETPRIALNLYNTPKKWVHIARQFPSSQPKPCPPMALSRSAKRNSSRAGKAVHRTATSSCAPHDVPLFPPEAAPVPEGGAQTGTPLGCCRAESGGSSEGTGARNIAGRRSIPCRQIGSKCTGSFFSKNRLFPPNRNVGGESSSKYIRLTGRNLTLTPNPQHRKVH